MNIEICGQEYPVTDWVRTDRGETIPLVDVPMMSDYKWHLSCLESRMKHPDFYRTVLGEDVDAVIEDLKRKLETYTKTRETV